MLVAVPRESLGYMSLLIRCGGRCKSDFTASSHSTNQLLALGWIVYVSLLIVRVANIFVYRHSSRELDPSECQAQSNYCSSPA